MTWEQKFAALCSLCDTSLKMREPGDWYVRAYGRETQKPGSAMLASESGRGPSPERAVENDWGKIALASQEGKIYVVIDAMSETERRHYRWNGYMWEMLPIDKKGPGGNSGAL